MGKWSKARDRKGHETSPIFFNIPLYGLSLQYLLFTAYIEILLGISRKGTVVGFYLRHDSPPISNMGILENCKQERKGTKYFEFTR